VNKVNRTQWIANRFLAFLEVSSTSLVGIKGFARIVSKIEIDLDSMNIYASQHKLIRLRFIRNFFCGSPRFLQNS